MEGLSLYRPILRRAWQIAKNKGLWFFAFFAAIVSSGGEYEIIGRALTNNVSGRTLIENILSGLTEGMREGLLGGGSIFMNFISALTSNAAALIIAIAIIILGVAVALFFIWLSTVSQIGLIKDISQLNKNKKISFSESMSQGGANFWQVLGSNILFKAILLIILMVIGQVLLMLGGSSVWLNIIYVIIFILLTVVILIASFLTRFQVMYVILKKQTWRQAWKSSYVLFIKNWLICIEMALLMFVFYVIVALVTTFVIAVLTAIPTVVLIVYLASVPMFAKFIIGVTCLVLMVLAMLASSILISVFQWAGWTLLFERINLKNEISKLMRLAQQLPFRKTAEEKTPAVKEAVRETRKPPLKTAKK